MQKLERDEIGSTKVNCSCVFADDDGARRRASDQ